MALERSRDKVSKAVFDMEPTAIIDFYRIYPNTVTKPKTYLNVHNGSVFGAGVYWQGELYSPIPMEVEGFSVNSSGKPNRPIIRISNKDLLMTNLLSNNEDFRNAKVERKRTFVRYLDDENFDGGNPWGEADENAEISVDLYFVSQKRQENKVFIELELTSPLDIESRDLTSRKILAKYCFWNYRGTGCDYKGQPVEREDGKPFTYGKGVGQNGSEQDKIIKKTTEARAKIARAEERSYIGMEEYDDPFIFANPNDLYNAQKNYRPGHIVYIINDRVRIQDVDNPNVFRSSLTYFVCRKYAAAGVDPRDNPEYWDKDGCGKKLFQCKSRFAKPSEQKIFLETALYEQRMWNIKGYKENEHQSFLRLKDNYNDIATQAKQLFKYNKKHWGYVHPDGETENYSDYVYENHFSDNSSSFTQCTADPGDGWDISRGIFGDLTEVSTRDLDKEFTFLLDIEYLGPPQRYEFYPAAEEEEEKQEDVDQIIFKTSKETVGYYSPDHYQFVIGLQKEPYIEFRSFAPYQEETDCQGRLNRLRLVGGVEDSDYFIVKNKNGLPVLPEGGYDVKNSRNFVFSLRKDTHEGKPRFRANWSCVTYPNDEEKEAVYIESRSTFYIKNMVTWDADRFVFFGGTTRMPVNDISGLNVTDVDKFTSRADTYVEKWSQQDLQVATMAIFDKSLTNGQLDKIKSQQNIVEQSATFTVEVVKLWEDVKSENENSSNKFLDDCLFFWQTPYKQDGIWYVKDHKNGNDLIYKSNQYDWAGGEKGVSYTENGYDFVDLQSIFSRTPNIGAETTIKGEFGTLPFGGFPGTDGYRFQFD